MRTTWLDFLAGRDRRAPVLLVLEDLHWGDFGTVRFIDAALRDRSQRPWMVLALARPRCSRSSPSCGPIARTSRRSGLQGARPQGRRAAGAPGPRRQRRTRHDRAPGQAGRGQRVLPRGADPRGRGGQGTTPCPRPCWPWSRRGSAGSPSRRGGCCAPPACSARCAGRAA